MPGLNQSARLFASALLILGTAPALLAQPASMTLADLAAAVESARSRINDMSVTFSFNASSGGENNLFARSRQTMIVKHSKLLIDHQYGLPAEIDPGTFHRITAFDGARSTFYMVERGSAGIISGREREQSTMGRGFFDLMMFNPIATDENGSNEMDLHSVLVSANSVVRSSLEEVDGRACYVVDETDPEAQGVTFTAWIDPGRGFLPVRQQYVNPVTHRVKMEFVTESALEIQPGIWLPVLGHKTLRPNVVVPECPSGIVETLMLDGYQQGHPAIAVNTGVDDSVFDVISSLPQGVRVLDQDTGQSWTVAAADRRGPSPDVEIARARGFPSRQVLVVLGSLLTSIGFAGTRRAGRRCPTGAMPR